jgi:phosphoribosylamine--glycine ligase
MNVLLLGSGGREHALAWKLLQSPKLTALWVAPGNPGIAKSLDARGDAGRFHCAKADPTDAAQVVALAEKVRAELVVVGPEAPLVAGIADALTAKGIAVFGPKEAAATIEGSKAFAKQVMAAAKVPTARFEVFDDLAQAEARAKAWGAVVVKADGLAAGKGVMVASDGEEAARAVKSLGKLEAGARILLEERMTGPELSVIALCDGERHVLLPPAQDHKRLRDGDQGPNTGGMGAYAPAPLLADAALEKVRETVITPTLAELKRRGSPFTGALFAGLMLTPDGPKVLEFNCRLGDPETQPLMMQTKDDLLEVFFECARGELKRDRLALHPGASVGVVIAAPGYPEAPRLGTPIEGLDAPPEDGVERFHAGTRLENGKLVTSGGRVLTVCARGASFAEARERAYREAARVRFEGAHFRTDIGAQALS